MRLRFGITQTRETTLYADSSSIRVDARKELANRRQP
jgi:hypothetical protein